MEDEDTRSAWWGNDADPTQVSNRMTMSHVPEPRVLDWGHARERPRGQRLRWFVPIAMVMAGLLSFSVVTVIVRAGHRENHVMPQPVASSSAHVPEQRAFPVDTVGTCLRDEKMVPNENAEQVRMKTGSQTSCDFLAFARNDVLARFATRSSTASFDIRPYSIATTKYITLHCKGDGPYFTICAGGRSAKMWIRNP